MLSFIFVNWKIIWFVSLFSSVRLKVFVLPFQGLVKLIYFAHISVRLLASSYWFVNALYILRTLAPCLGWFSFRADCRMEVCMQGFIEGHSQEPYFHETEGEGELLMLGWPIESFLIEAKGAGFCISPLPLWPVTRLIPGCGVTTVENVWWAKDDPGGHWISAAGGKGHLCPLVSSVRAAADSLPVFSFNF